MLRTSWGIASTTLLAPINARRKEGPGVDVLGQLPGRLSTGEVLDGVRHPGVAGVRARIVGVGGEAFPPNGSVGAR
jgi:hypothetical protein